MDECDELHGAVRSQARVVPQGVQMGRVWGVWNEEMLPVRWETVEVSLKDAYRIRRIYRIFGALAEALGQPFGTDQ